MDTVTVDLTQEEIREFMEVLKARRVVAEDEPDRAVSQRPETCQPLINVGKPAEPHEKPTSALETLGHIALAAWVLVALYWLIRVLGA